MSRSLVSTDHLSEMVEDCKEDMKSGNGTKLMSLATFMQSIATATDNPVYHSIPSAIGQFGSELQQSRNMVILPVLPEEVREKQEKVLGEAIDVGLRSLETIKNELCNDTGPDCRKLLEAVGSLHKHSSRMYLERRAVRPPFSAEGEDTE